MTMNFNRQWKLVNHKKIKPIGMIGAGSIGSWTVFMLAKMGATDIEVWDPDIVEQVNCPAQLYRPEIDEGKPKVEALRKIVKDFTGVEIKIHQAEYDGTRKPWIICGVDSIKTRKEIFDKYIDNKITVERYFDARMGGEISIIHSLRPTSKSDCERYRKSLFNQEDAAEEKCGERSVVYNTAYIATELTDNIKRLVMGMPLVDYSDHSWKNYEASSNMTDKSYRYTVTKGK